MTQDRGSPRLRFTEEELDTPELKSAAKKAEKAADKYEKAQKKLPQKHRLKLVTEEAAQVEASTGSTGPVQEDVPLTDPSAPAVMNTRKKPDAKSLEKVSPPAKNSLEKAELKAPDAAAQAAKKKRSG